MSEFEDKENVTLEEYIKEFHRTKCCICKRFIDKPEVREKFGIKECVGSLTEIHVCQKYGLFLKKE